MESFGEKGWERFCYDGKQDGKWAMWNVNILSEDIDGYQIYTDSHADIRTTKSTADKPWVRGTWLIEHCSEIEFTISKHGEDTNSRTCLYLCCKKAPDQKQELMSFRFDLDAQTAVKALNAYLGEISNRRSASNLNDIGIQGKGHKVFWEDYRGRRIYADSEGNVFSTFTEGPPRKILSGSWLRQMGSHMRFEQRKTASPVHGQAANIVRLHVDEKEYINVVYLEFERETKIVTEELTRHVQRMTGEGAHKPGEGEEEGGKQTGVHDRLLQFLDGIMSLKTRQEFNVATLLLEKHRLQNLRGKKEHDTLEKSVDRIQSIYRDDNNNKDESKIIRAMENEILILREGIDVDGPMLFAEMYSLMRS